MKNQIIEPVLTESFEKAVLTLEKTITERRIVGVVTPPGVGFQFAIQRFALKHYLRIIYADVQRSQDMNSILIALNEEIGNVKFSRLRTKATTLHNLTLSINNRVMEQDLSLIVIDHCDFTKTQLKYFIRFLRGFNRKVGLVFRMPLSYYNRLKNTESTKEVFAELRKVTDHWKSLASPQADDIREICKAHLVKDEMMISDLITVCDGNLSLLKKHIDQYFEYLIEQKSKLR